MTDAPDATPAIAALLDEAAGLAAASTAKLDEALAIAERNATFNADRQWFKSRPDRSYRARLATAQEVEDLHSSGAWPESFGPSSGATAPGSKRSTSSCARHDPVRRL